MEGVGLPLDSPAFGARHLKAAFGASFFWEEHRTAATPLYVGLPLSVGGAGSLFSTISLGPRPTSVPSSPVQPCDHNRHGPKSAGRAAVPLSMGELGLYLTQYRLGRRLPPYQVTS